MGRILDIREEQARQEAAGVIRAGGLVAFPTETVYGLGADAFNPRAVARIFEAKGRPAFDPLIAHLRSVEELPRVAVVRDKRALALAARFWPGPLTLVLPKKKEVPNLVTAGLPTVGVRVPRHRKTLDFLRLCGTPVAAPSANPFGYVSPTTAAHVSEQLGGKVDLILDGGPCAVGLESTILALDAGPARLLRPGAVTIEDLRQVLGEVVVDDGARNQPQAPGQMEKHYSTRTPLRFLEPGGRIPEGVKGRLGLLAFKPAPADSRYVAAMVLSASGDLEESAANLFSALRELDNLGLDMILAEACQEKGIGAAIMNRLRRAAAE